MGTVSIREAGARDAEGIARLHADSWRRHYRGAYADSFLDGDVEADRLRVWGKRLAARGRSFTLVAEDDDGPAGFVHVVFDDDVRWGTLIDNLHVRSDRRRTGIGSRLIREAAQAAVDHAIAPAIYLWVLEQNEAAQAFYAARGGEVAERHPCRPAGIPVHGEPHKLRLVWPSATTLAD